MDSEEIRKTFLDFFQEKDHAVVDSSSLIPKDDSVLFTSAGMQQFKPYFLGQECEHGDRVTSVQKCFRTSDIEQIGDKNHLTFLEMLGNFSFGDYFKRQAMVWALDLLAQYGLDQERLHVTYFKGNDDVSSDQQAYNIWRDLGFSDDQIEGLGREENFWGPTGNFGPCGPTVEIYYDTTQQECPECESAGVNCSCGRFVELWNIVFNQYFQDAKGDLSPLEQEGVDTGMGLERLVMVVQDTPTVFETDLFKPLIDIVEQESSVCYSDSPRPFRTIADHIRGIVFLIGAGIKPDKEGRGYILRRLIRYLIEQETKLNLDNFNYRPLVEFVIEKFQHHYTELNDIESKVIEILTEERKRIQKTTTRGLEQLEKLSSKNISGQKAFYLYSTYGLSPEEIREQGYNFAQEEFEKAMEEHQKVSRQGAEEKFGGHGLKKGDQQDQQKVRLHTATHLLQAALRDLFGPEVEQRGSDINTERLRFDFSFSRSLTDKEISRIEEWIDDKIERDLAVEKNSRSLEQAKEEGFLTVSGASYPDEVSVYTILDESGKSVSKEVCAGPHVENIGELGEFKIIKEKSSGRGVRRIKAILK